MGRERQRFVAKTVEGIGWRIWNTKTKRWWVEFCHVYPEVLLQELNGERRPSEITRHQ
jgi:hypothetical protein